MLVSDPTTGRPCKYGAVLEVRERSIALMITLVKRISHRGILVSASMVTVNRRVVPVLSNGT